MLMLGSVTMPDWLTNPWLHAIVITPVMFYCGAPIHRHGMPALHQRTPNADSLISLGMINRLCLQSAAMRGVLDFSGRLTRSVFRVRSVWS